jgi:hypothetical protein
VPARLSGERSEAAIERRHVPSGLSVSCREVSSPAGKARSAAAAIVVPSGLSVFCRVVFFPAGKARSAVAAIVQLYAANSPMDMRLTLGYFRWI